MKIISLFSGCGGLDLGFRNVGFETVLVNDVWERALETYAENNKEKSFESVLGDITKKDIRDRIVQSSKNNDIDIVLGGPPCQDFSSAGGRNGNGKRANLTPEFAEIVSEIKPKWAVMENVNTIRVTGERQLKKCKNILHNSGYGITISILNSADFGIPQERKRLILISRLGGVDNEMLPFLEKQKKPTRTVKEFIPEIVTGDKATHYYYRHPRTYQRRAIFSVDELSPVIRGVNRTIPKTYKIHENDATSDISQVRSLTTEERARIQSFPKDFTVIGNKGDKETQLGNAVPPLLAEGIARAILAFEKKRKN